VCNSLLLCCICSCLPVELSLTRYPIRFWKDTNCSYAEFINQFKDIIDWVKDNLTCVPSFKQDHVPVLQWIMITPTDPYTAIALPSTLAWTIKYAIAARSRPSSLRT